MKKQKAITAAMPKTTVDLHLDFHGVDILIPAFDVLRLGNKKCIYLAMDYDGSVTLYQYKPTPDLSFKDFDSGLDPENSLLSGFCEEAHRIDTMIVDPVWNKSVIKYTIEVPDE
jgi:hypothetical protein